MKFCALSSSSRGNCCYISSGSGSILVDAGISSKRIFCTLESIDVDPLKISAILITHEHIDHVSGLRVLAKRTGADVYATRAVLEYLARNNMVEASTRLFEVDGQPFSAAGIKVTAFPTSHDSVGSVGYRIELQDERKIGIATDLGVVTDEVISGVSGCEVVMLESNYDEDRLWNGPYPYITKKRIASPMGHLSNGSSAMLSQYLIQNGTTRLVLAHLSQENNTPQLAQIATELALNEISAVRGKDYDLMVAPHDCAERLVRI